MSARGTISILVKTLKLMTLRNGPCQCINIVIKSLGTGGSDQIMFLRYPLDVATISTHAKQQLGRQIHGDSLCKTLHQ